MLGRTRHDAAGGSAGGLLWLVVIAMTVGAVAAAGLGALHGLSNSAHDALVRVRNEDRPAPTSVVLFEVDDETLTAENDNLPLSRNVYAEAITRLAALKPRAIAVDIQFTENSEDEDADYALYEAIDKAPMPIILGTSTVRDDGDTAVFGGKQNLDPAGAVAAHSGFPRDDGDVVRRIDATIAGIPTIAQAAAESVGSPGLPRDGVLLDPTVPGDELDRLSLNQLLEGQEVKPEPFDPKRVRGRIAVIGVTVAGPSGDDRVTIAGSSERVFGVQFQAQAIDTALRGEPLRDATRVLPYVLALLVGLGAALSARRTLWLQLGVAFASLVALIALSVVLVKSGWLTDPVPALVALVVASLGAMAVRAETERRQRAAARATLGRFVPPGVVDDLLTSEAGGLIAPRAQGATVVFCDLRGYTSLVASLREPSALISILDVYLSAVTETVHRHGGTVVSFQGDGVMSAFGTPVETPEAAAQAVAAARDLLDVALPRVRAELASVVESADELRLGVGVATGAVFAGTVGPPERREYAVVGPTTNLAARLQALTKTEGVDVVLDSTTAAAARGPSVGSGDGDGKSTPTQRAHTGIDLGNRDGLRLLGPREIRGLDAPIEVWTLAKADAPTDDEPRAPADA